MTITLWDILLLIAISILTTLVAYLNHPRWKALMLSLPIPFTLVFLSLNRSIDATNVAAMLILLLYTHSVRILYYTFKLPIVFSILISVALYIGSGTMLTRIIPRTDTAFWILLFCIFLIALVIRRFELVREESPHRSTLPLYIKIPIIVVMVAMLLAMKQLLKGFMTLFPMVGVFASYEARYSLWTNCRQIPIVILTMAPMFAVVKIIQPRYGIGWAAAGGWAIFFLAMIPVFLEIVRNTRGVEV